MSAQPIRTDRIDPARRPGPAGTAAAYRDPTRQRPPGVEVVRGRQAIGLRWLEAQRSATRELLILDRPPYVLEPERARRRVQHELLRRGVRCRTIYDREAMESPGCLASARQLGALGEDGRTVAGLPMKLLIADRKVGLVSHLHGQEEYVLLHGSALLDGLVTLFDLLWHQATPLRPPPADAAHEATETLSADDRRLLSLAADGLTDHAVARRLGVAQRTVERRMRRIMDRLGARTRFQAGLQAARRGMLIERLPGVPAVPGGDETARRQHR
jgi:DNA-binding CsgD family transcriptional regulator